MKSFNRNIRLWGTLALAVLAAAALTACSGGSSGSSAAAEPDQTTEAAAETGAAAVTEKAENDPGQETESGEAGKDASEALNRYAEMIYDSLDETWGECKKVSCDENENRIYVLVWEKGINTADILVSQSWKTMKQWHIDSVNTFLEGMKEAGIPDAHLDYRYTADTEDVSFLSLADGEIIYDIREDGLPGFVYNGDDPYLNTIWEYLRDTKGESYEPGDLMIPAFIILDEEDGDPQDIRVWGSFWLINYDLVGHRLITKNGGCYPACIHLAETADGYEVTDAEFVEDGSNYDPTARAIFGEKEGLLEAFEASYDRMEDSRASYINMYTEQTGIDIQSWID